MTYTKRLTLSVLFLLGTLYSTGTCAQTYNGPEEDINEILKVSRAFSEHYMNARYDSLAGCYTEDAAILPPGTDIRGRKAIKERWILPEGLRITYHKATPTELVVQGDFAYDVGYYEGKTLQKDGEEVSWKGKYLIVWKRTGDTWRLHMDAWNGLERN